MLKKFSCLVVLFVCLGVAAQADDLYKITLRGPADAALARSLSIEPLVRQGNAYLVLTGDTDVSALKAAGLGVEFIAAAVDKQALALDNSRDDRNVARFETMYEENGLRLFRLDGAKAAALADGSSLIPIRNDRLAIVYRAPQAFNTAYAADPIDLDSLVGLVDYDSAYSYLHTLQAFNGRVAGTSSNYAARDWLRAKLQSFGYTSVTLDNFSSYVYGSWESCYNVVAYKEGTVYPDRQIVVGAHFDAVPGSPGADDNGSGSVGVLEIARALADLETEMSFVFILFDSEEQGLNGAWHYADLAAARGDSIVCMLNMDMIGYIANDNYADIKYGAVDGYARLWGDVSAATVGLSGVLGGNSSSSDHYAFDQNGFDVVYAGEYVFSSVYHTPQDSTSYIDFTYMTRMIKATLGTAYTINLAPLPVAVTSVVDAGDGQSLQVNWVGDNSGMLDYYHIDYHDEYSSHYGTVDVPAGQSSIIIEGLTEGVEYYFTIVAFDLDGRSSLIYDLVSGIPYSLPQMPSGLTALPQYHGIKLDWTGHNTELDFSHFTIVRDGIVLPVEVTGNFYVDEDMALGSDFHDYLVVAVDDGGSISDTVGAVPVRSRAATLQPGRLLAANRSSMFSQNIVDEAVTGQFINDALAGYDFDYMSDTAYASGIKPDTLDLFDMINYEVVVLGGEAGRIDDLGGSPLYGGILKDLGYYLSLGGKVVVFGRWGDLRTGSSFTDVLTYDDPAGFNYTYNQYFHIGSRTQYLSSYTTTTLTSDLVGAVSQVSGYPDLIWDSLASSAHSIPWSQVGGVPCPTFVALNSAAPDVIYRYDSRGDYYLTENQPIGWRYLGEDYQYIYFEFPLSFFEGTTAAAALQAAVDELISAGPAAATALAPDTIDASAPGSIVSVYLGDFLDGMTAADVSAEGVLVNGSVIPSTTQILPSMPPFSGDVLAVYLNAESFLDSYFIMTDTNAYDYSVTFDYTGQPGSHTVYGRVTLVGFAYVSGDANDDGMVNVGDAVYIINYAFKDGPAPDPLDAGDANCDGSVNVGDAVFLINFVFKGGPPPPC